MTTTSSTIDRGDTVLEVVIAVPIVLTLLLIAVQAMLFMHSAHIATLSAAKGASIAASADGEIVSAIDSATRTAAELGAQLVGTPSLTVNDGFVVMRVRVAVPNVAMFFPSSVERGSEEPLEDFVREDER
jgi:flagellar basal body-associated protein FliL